MLISPQTNFIKFYKFFIHFYNWQNCFGKTFHICGSISFNYKFLYKIYTIIIWVEFIIYFLFFINLLLSDRLYFCMQSAFKIFYKIFIYFIIEQIALANILSSPTLISLVINFIQILYNLYQIGALSLCYWRNFYFKMQFNISNFCLMLAHWRRSSNFGQEIYNMRGVKGKTNRQSPRNKYALQIKRRQPLIITAHLFLITITI